jgi:hypothetical protein
MSQMQPIQTVQTIDDLTQFNPQIGPYDWPEEYEKTTVFVQGYYKAGDGGGGIFIYRRYVNLGVTQPFADGGIFIECDVSAQNADTRGIWMRSFSGYIDVYSVIGIIPNYGSSTAYLYAYLSSDVIESNNDYKLRTEINYYTYEYSASLDVSYSSSTTNGNTILDDKYFKFEYASSGGINYEIPPGNYYLILKLVWNEDKNTSNNKLITPVTVY